MFSHLVKHAKSYDVKLPIGFPSLLSGMMIAQKRDLLRTDDIDGKPLSELSFSHKLFEGKHARDLVMPSIATSVASGHIFKVAPLSEDAKSDILKGLYEEVVALKEIIYTSSRRKTACERLISVMTFSSTSDGATSSQPGHTVSPDDNTDDEDTEDDVLSESKGSEGQANDVSNPSS